MAAVAPAVIVLAADAATAVASACGAARADGAYPIVALSSGWRTRWANPYERASVRRRPTAVAPTMGRLRRLTEDGAAEVYVVLRSTCDRAGDRWLEVALPRRPNGQRGWVRSRALGPLHLTRTVLEIDRRRLVAVLSVAGKRVWSARVGVGTAATPTPKGRFWVREILTSDPAGAYGPYAIGTSAYSRLSDWPSGGVVGIHGTDRPDLVPGRPSHGCIRLHNGDIRVLAARLPIGARVVIR